MYTGLGVTQLPRTYPSQTGLTEAEEVNAYCRFQPCGSRTCPCAAGYPVGTIPGAVQTLPTLTATAVPPWGWVLAVLALWWLASSSRVSRKEW